MGMPASVPMVDATHAHVANVPVVVPKVAGYDTGSPDVAWTDADWARFPKSGHIRIDQGFGADMVMHSQSFDFEARAFQPKDAPDIVHRRISAGIHWTNIYASDGILALVADALHAAGPAGWYSGHVDCWLADWDLSETQARQLLGREIHGFTCRAVQWASPTSNPATLVPWSSLSLAQAQVDLSVTEPGWHAWTPPAPPPPPHLDALATARQLAADLAGLQHHAADLVSQLGG